MHNLLLLFFIPIIASGLVFILPNILKKGLKTIAACLSLIPLFLLLYLHGSWIGSAIDLDWIPRLSIRFHLSIDSISLLFLYLTALIIPLSIISVRSDQLSHPNAFYGLILFLEGLLIGFFTARDLALFTFLYEAMLIPVYFLIVQWGGSQRQAAGLKFLTYMIAGSALLIVAVLSLYFSSALAGDGTTGTFNLDALAKISMNLPFTPIVCGIFLLAFAVKTPLFPFHAWLPDTYCQASTSGTILLSSLLSKAGIYGFLRVSMTLFPVIMQEWSPYLLTLAVTGVFYGAFAAWKQNDFKRLIAYSSLSHVNFILAGLFAWSQVADSGAILQAFNHGITIAALFLVAGWLEDRLESTEMVRFSGLSKYLPKLCWLTLFFILSSVALPGTNNFVGELMIFFGLFGKNPWLAAFLTLSVVFSAVYMLSWMQKMYFGTPHVFRPLWIDIGGKEITIALPLIALILWVGIYPSPILTKIKPAVEKILATVTTEPQK